MRCRSGGSKAPAPGQAAAAFDRLSPIKWGVRYRLMILGVVTYVLVVARTGTGRAHNEKEGKTGVRS